MERFDGFYDFIGFYEWTVQLGTPQLPNERKPIETTDW